MRPDDTSLIALYSNLSAITIVLGVFYMHVKAHKKKDTGYRLFAAMLISALICSVSSLCEGTLSELFFSDLPIFRTFAATIEELMIDIVCLEWFVYVLYRCFGSRDYLIRSFKYYIIPLVIIVIFDVINLFTGILFYTGADLSIRYSILGVIVDVIGYGYFLGSGLILLICRTKSRHMFFLNIWLIFIPVVAGSIFEDVTGYASFSLGLAIGEAILIISDSNAQIFEDPETGFFNLRYCQYIKELLDSNRYDLGSILICGFSDREAVKGSALPIRNILPEDLDIIRISGNEIMILAPITDRAPVNMLSEEIKNLAEKPGASVKTESFFRQKNESGREFLDRFFEGRELPV